MSMLIKNARLSFPDLFKATAFKPDQEKKFKGTFIIPKDHPQLAELKAEINAVIKEKWGKRPGQLTADKICLQSGKKKVGKDGEYMDGFGPDVLFFNANNVKRPTVFDRDRTPLTEQDGRPYAGCYVNVRISLWAQDNDWGKRINAELNGVQFAADGDAFGGGGPPSSSDEFPELEPDGPESDWEGETGVEEVDDDPFADDDDLLD